jgi:hypothetical protein
MVGRTRNGASMGYRFLDLPDGGSAARLAAFAAGAGACGAALTDNALRSGASVDLTARAFGLQCQVSEELRCPAGENRALLILGSDWFLACSAALCAELPRAERARLAGEGQRLSERQFRGRALERQGAAAPGGLEPDYLAWAADTTGAVFGLMTSVAARRVNAGQEVCDALYSFGELLGMVIHIEDHVSAASVRGPVIRHPVAVGGHEQDGPPSRMNSVLVEDRPLAEEPPGGARSRRALARRCRSEAESALAGLERLLGEPAAAGLGALLPGVPALDSPGTAR